MNVQDDVKGVMRLMRDVLGVVVWIVATTWLGGRMLWRLGVLVSRSPRLLAQTARCPRGHTVPLYGVFRCASCHAQLEGYVFRPCRFCGSTPSWTPCPRCSLGVGNPLR